jgi:hypothetical protein
VAARDWDIDPGVWRLFFGNLAISASVASFVCPAACWPGLDWPCEQSVLGDSNEQLLEHTSPPNVACECICKAVSDLHCGSFHKGVRLVVEAEDRMV